MKTLRDLKAGDTVIIHKRDYLDRPKEIERVTETQIVVAGEKYNRDSGRAVGDFSNVWRSISVPKDGEIEECFAAIRLHKVKAHLTLYPWRELNDIELLEKIKAMLPNNTNAVDSAKNKK